MFTTPTEFPTTDIVKASGFTTHFPHDSRHLLETLTFHQSLPWLPDRTIHTSWTRSQSSSVHYPCPLHMSARTETSGEKKRVSLSASAT